MFLRRVLGSPSLELVNLVLNKQAKGKRVISLAVGEPSLNTPSEIVDVACRSMRNGDVHYTSSYGTWEIRQSIRRKVARRNQIHCATNNCIFLTTKLALYAALLAVSDTRYEALIPDPGYFYSEPVMMSGGKPVYYKLASDFSLDLDEIKRRASAKTKVLIVNTPSNPTGKVLKKSELEELFDFCSERYIRIISDEAYEDLVYEGEHFSIGSFEKEPNTVVSTFSLSKSYAMTGWRAGYVVANEEIVYLINKFLENSYTCFPPFIQKASSFGLDHGDRFINEIVMELGKRRKLMEERIAEVEALVPNRIEGAFYAFPSFKSKISSRELARRILEKYGVAVLPGTAFGPSGERHLRVSFSVEPEIINQGMDKVKAFFKSLRN